MSWLYFLMTSVYMWLFTVASVAIIPILLFFVFSTATFAPGLTTPIIGISKSFLMSSKAKAVAVLQAITIALTFLVSKNFMICLEYLTTVFLDLLPYGTLAVSPKYTILSLGSCLIISLATVRPPTPESKTPTGASESIFEISNESNSDILSSN